MKAKLIYRIIEVIGFVSVILSVILLIAKRHIDIGNFAILFENHDLIWLGGMIVYLIGYGLRTRLEKKEIKE